MPVANVLGGEEGRGFGQLMTQLAQERLLIGVTAVATMEAAVAENLSGTNSRSAFGQTIFDFQNTRSTLAQCEMVAHAARAFINAASSGICAENWTPPRRR